MNYFNKIWIACLLFLNITTHSMLRASALMLCRKLSTPHMPFPPGAHRVVQDTPSAHRYQIPRGDGTLLSVDGSVLPSPTYVAPNGRCIQCNRSSLVVSAPVRGNVHNFIIKKADIPNLPVYANNAATRFQSSCTTDSELLKAARNSNLKKAFLNAGLFTAGIGATVFSARNQSELGVTVGVGISAYNGLAGFFAVRDAYRINRYYQAFN